MSYERAGTVTSPQSEFTPEQWDRIDGIVADGKGRPGSLIPVLEEVQGVTGYLPESVQRRVAIGLDIPLARVYGVVTFYSYFTMKPRGRHSIKVCLGTACHVAGATEVLAELGSRLGCEPGEMSADGVFDLSIVRCLGACGLAPVVHIDGDTHSQVRPAQVTDILRHYRDGGLTTIPEPEPDAAEVPEPEAKTAVSAASSPA